MGKTLLAPIAQRRGFHRLSCWHPPTGPSKTANMRVFIATPTTNGTCMAAYAKSVVEATIALQESGATYRMSTLDGADVVTSRTILTHRFLSDSSCDHILFIDSDMAIDPAVFRHILAQKVPIIGTAYAERSLNLETYHEAMTEADDPARARALASRFTVRMTPGEKRVRDMITEVAAFGFGCVLIQRSVFEALVAGKHVAPYRSSMLRAFGIEDPVWDFFAPIQTDEGTWLSEDYAFCRRVRDLGTIPLRAYIGPGVGHIGQFTYGAPYIERLKAGKV